MNDFFELALSSRLLIFLSLFVAFSGLEILFPAYKFGKHRRERWPTNIGLTLLNSLLTRALVFVATIQVASWAKEEGFGLFFFLFEEDSIIANIISIALLDFIIYWQHRFFHKLDFFWKFHKVHHSDEGFDVTTGFRFHPIEIVFSLMIKAFAVIVFGIDPLSVLIFEIILSSMALFNHGNYSLGLKVDHFARLLIVTPDMHRIHHSNLNEETNANFGFNLSLWDRIFGSYKKQSNYGVKSIVIGIANQPVISHLGHALKLPFEKRSLDD